MLRQATPCVDNGMKFWVMVTRACFVTADFNNDSLSPRCNGRCNDFTILR